jgi:hypothetical protein
VAGDPQERLRDVQRGGGAGVNRSKGLTPVPLRRSAELTRNAPLTSRVPLKAVSITRAAGNGASKNAAARKPIKPVSDKRRAENRERRAMADRRWPDRRDGTVMCEVPGCTFPADDLHEPKFRSRLGSPTDPENTIPVCRQHHDWIHAHPKEAHDLGLAVHSWE